MLFFGIKKRKMKKSYSRKFMIKKILPNKTKNKKEMIYSLYDNLRVLCEFRENKMTFR